MSKDLLVPDLALGDGLILDPMYCCWAAFAAAWGLCRRPKGASVNPLFSNPLLTGPSVEGMEQRAMRSGYRHRDRRLVAHTPGSDKVLLYVRQCPMLLRRPEERVESRWAPRRWGRGVTEGGLPGLSKRASVRDILDFSRSSKLLSRVTPQMLQETRATELALPWVHAIETQEMPLRAERRVELLRLQPAPVTERMMDNAARRSGSVFRP